MMRTRAFNLPARVKQEFDEDQRGHCRVSREELKKANFSDYIGGWDISLVYWWKKWYYAYGMAGEVLPGSGAFTECKWFRARSLEEMKIQIMNDPDGVAANARHAWISPNAE